MRVNGLWTNVQFPVTNGIFMQADPNRIDSMGPTYRQRGAPAHPDFRSAARLVFITLAVWVGLGVFMGVQVHLTGTPSGKSIELWTGIEMSVRRYLIYAVLTFPVLWLCRRFPPTSKRWVLPLTAHAVGLTLFVVLYAALRTLSGSTVDRATLQRLPVSLETATTLIRSNVFEQFTMYTSMVIAALALQYHREYRRREVREADLRRQMAEYELQILKLQLHPHFLFNAMNGIATLMARDTRTAREMLLRLSDLLRMALSHSGDDEVSLRDEIEFVKAYLEIERMRFGERLRVGMNIDLASLEARVPNMIIQPLVENAIHYGIARTRAGGALELATECAAGRLRISIVNDGPAGRPAPEPFKGPGIGLSNAKSRLSRLYGDAFELRLLDRPQGGAEIHLEMPFRRTNGAGEGSA